MLDFRTMRQKNWSARERQGTQIVMNGEDGNENNEQEPEIHPGPDVIQFANTFVSFRQALTKALEGEGESSEPLGTEHEIELFRIWYMDKTDREMLQTRLKEIDELENGDSDPEWYSDSN